MSYDCLIALCIYMYTYIPNVRWFSETLALYISLTFLLICYFLLTDRIFLSTKLLLTVTRWHFVAILWGWHTDILVLLISGSLGHWVKFQTSGASSCILLDWFEFRCGLTTSRLCLYFWQLAATGGSSNQRGMLTNLARTIADQSEVASKFFCHICNACLSSKTSLVTHIKGSHLAASMFNCDQCGESFKWYMQLHRHRRRFHGNDADLHGNGSDYHGNEYETEADFQWWQFETSATFLFSVRFSSASGWHGCR